MGSECYISAMMTKGELKSQTYQEKRSHRSCDKLFGKTTVSPRRGCFIAASDTAVKYHLSRKEEMGKWTV